MPPHDASLEQDGYRVILVRSGSSQIWTERDANGLRLPRVTVLRWRRPAQQLQEVIERAWSIRVILLDILPAERGGAPCAIAEITSSAERLSLTKSGIGAIPEQEMSLEERGVLQTILDGDGRACGPFSCMGWIKEAIEWLRSEIGPGVRLTDDIRQYNASAHFALVRFGTTNGPAFWLKATGEPNAHEFEVTRNLARVCPEFLPTQIAARKDWNAWLMEDAGQPLDFLDQTALEHAVLTMAVLQQKTVGKTIGLLTAGALDQRVPVLRANLGEVIEYLEEAMAKQRSTKVPRISSSRMREIEAVLQDACLRMEELEIPDTVVHNDINVGNLLFRGTRCVFADWCEVGVGNPFFTFELLSRLQPRGEQIWASSLRDAYKRRWHGFLNEFQIEGAFALSPLLAILSYLYGRGTWLHSAQRHDPGMESHARSLARHIDRAADALQLMEVKCR